MKKYRAGKIKREHSVIEGLWPVLEHMAECDRIASIIPGPITRLRSRGFEVTFQRFTETGLRLLAKNGSALQEVYAVAPDKEGALAWLADQKIVDWQPEPAPVVRTAPEEPRKTVAVPADSVCAVCGKAVLAGSRAVRKGRGRYHYVHVRCDK